MKKIMFLLAFFVGVGLQVFGQTTITGTVTGAEDGMPIPGATVRVKGFTDVGTITGMDGKYTLQVPQAGTTLIFSFVGMKTQEIPIAGTTVNAVLVAEDVTVSDVVVTAMGIVRQPKELGYAISKVDKELLNQSKTVSVTNSLSGKVAGLQVSTVNNSVAADTRITLRGNRSLTGNNQALLVLDGVPTSLSYINTINPNDIESVSVLKGANASALYGSEAANGVIQIQTKKGTSGKNNVEFNSTTTFESISFMPKLQTRFGSGSGTDANGYAVYTPYENQNYGPQYDGSTVDLGLPVLINGQQVVQKIAYQDNSKEKIKFWNTGVTTQNMLSYSGGDERNKFYISLQDALIKGVVPKDEARRTTLRFNGERRTGNLRLGTNIAYTNSSKDVAGGSQFQDRSVYWLVMNTPNGIPLTQYKDWKNDPYADQNGYFNAYYENPYAVIDYSRQKSHTDYLVGTFEAEYKIIPALTALFRSSVNYNNSFYQNTKEAVRFTPFAASLSDRSISTKGDYNGQDFEGSGVSRRWTNDFILSYDREFGSISTRVVGGVTNRESYIKTMDIGSNALQIDNYYNIKNRIGDPTTLTSGWSKLRSIGAYADLTLGYNKMLYLHATGRNDWTSLLAKGNNSFFYPGVDVSFVFSDVLPDVVKNIVSFGKLRAGLTQVGTLNLNPYQLENVFLLNSGFGFPYGTTTAFTMSDVLNNRNLKPEMTTSQEAGLELGLLESKINLDLTVYKNSTKDQTIRVDLPNSSGYTGTMINTGELQSKGFEAQLKATVLRLSNSLTWNIGINYTYQQTKVIKITDDLKEIFLGGYGSGSGVYAKEGELYPLLKNIDFKRDPNGRIIVDAKTGYPSAESAASYAGCTAPKNLLGINTSINFKGFSLSAVFEYRNGAIIWNDIADALTFTGTGYLSASNGRQRFVYPNSVYQSGTDADGKPLYAQNTDIATATGGVEFWTNIFNSTERFSVTSADFWKLRELTLTYSVPMSVLPKFIKGVSAGIVARNVFTLLPKSNIYTDPEFSFDTSNAIGLNTINQTPPTRTVGFNISITF